MKKIILSGELGWEISPFQVQESLDEAAGDDVEIVFSTPGGIIGAGLEINSAILNYKKENPKAQLIAHILEASSMGSHIASNPSFDLRTAEETSIAMIHNPQNGMIGDYRLMRKNADFLERLAAVMGLAYMKILKVSTSEIQKIMDEEKWYIGGKALVKAGFADEIITTASDKTKEAAHSEAEIRFKSVMEKVRLFEIKESDFEKAVALIKDYKIPNKIPDMSNSIKPAVGGNNKIQEDVLMDPKELKEKHPTVYAEMKTEMMKAGAEQGVKAEKERVKSLLEMKKKKEFEGIESVHLRIDEAIEKGEAVAGINVALMAILSKNSILAANDSPGDIVPGGDDTVSGEADKNSDIKVRW